MENWKKKFKEKCSEYIFKMLNDDKVTYERFFRETRSVEMLYKRYVNKLAFFHTQNSYSNLYEAYLGMLKSIYTNAVEAR
jgi:hypothetical protein